MHEYEELRIRIWKTGENRYLVFANGPEAAAAPVHLPKPPEEYRQALDALLLEEFKERPPDPLRTTWERVRELGRELFEAFLPEPVRECLEESLRLAQAEKKRLRVRFDVAAELMDVPFELLCSPQASPLGNLALQQELSPVRSLKGLSKSPLRLPQAEEEREYIGLLIIVACPRGEEPLAVQREISEIERALPPIWKADGPERPLQVLGGPSSARARATRQNISKLMGRQKAPCAVLIIAHGDYDQKESYVLLEREDGSADRVPGEILKTLLAKAPGLRLVVLNLCMGAKAIPGEPFAGLAQALISAGIPAVVAMQTEVSDKAASDFSPALFNAICDNRTIDEAVLEGRLQMARTENTWSEWCTPAVYLHESCGHGWLFKVPAATAAPDPLREAKSILERVKKNRSVENFLHAARVLRWTGAWKQVQNKAEVGIDQVPDDSPYERLVLEAKAELSVEECKKICGQLASEEDPRDAEESLKKVKEDLRPELLRPLSDEVERARELWEIFQQAIAAVHHEAWQRAIDHYDEILTLSPAGYRDALDRREVAREELQIAQLDQDAVKATEAKDWPKVRDLCLKILERRPQGYKEASSLLHYAEGRIAEVEEDQWAKVIDAYEKVSENFLHVDVQQRLPYARGRAAELEADSKEKWERAAAAYALLLPDGFSDSGVRLPYARARVAELEGRWTDVVTELESLDQSFSDVQDRLPYARGRRAETKEEWQAVIDGFGTLSDGYREGDVGLRRNFARAHVAGDDWRGVAESLCKVPDDYRDGTAGRMRWYAQGRLAEEGEGEKAPDWSAAAVAYGRVIADYRDAGLRRAYAQGRNAEEIEDWDAAVEAFGSLPEGSREDVGPRASYARGRLAEARQQWDDAVAALAQLPAEFLDTGERLCYVQAHSAEERADWPGVLAALAALGAVRRDVSRMEAYARGRLAEGVDDWQSAAVSYGTCSDYGDALDRLIYAQGRSGEAAGSWRQALETYDRLPADHRDVESRRSRLRNLLDVIPWVDGLASAGMIADPGAARDGVSPYEELRKAGIHPGSPAEEVKNASFLLMVQGLMRPEARLAWDRVRTPEIRLKVDAFLYRLRDPEDLRRALQDLTPGPASDVLRALRQASPGDAPLFLLLDGRRKQGIEAWDALRWQAPEQTPVAHCLALAHFWRARELEASGAYEQAELAWEHSIAHWALVLSDDAYWAGWRQDRAARYRQAVTQSDVARLRSQLGQEILNILTRYADDYAAEGRAERAERYKHLAVALEVELAGARALKEVGGLPLVGVGDRNLVCGPLYLRHAGLGRLVGERIARLEAEAGSGGEPEDLFTALDAALGASLGEAVARVTPDALYRLRCAFSELGKPGLLLERDQPEQALQALPALYQTKLSELPADCGRNPCAAEAKSHFATCPHCQGFLRSNPGYLCLPHRSTRWFQDAVELATRAYLDLAQTALTSRREGYREALRCWQEAIEVSRNAGAHVRTKRAIVRVVLGRADSLDQESGPQRRGRLTEAIELIEGARELIRGADEGQLVAKAAEILTDRGVWYGNGGEGDEDPDFEKAAQDLRRALELTPGALRALDNLCRALTLQAGNLPLEEGAQRAFGLFAEALRFLHDGLQHTAGHQPLRQILHEVLVQLDDRVLFELSPEELTRILAESDAGTEGSLQLAARAEEKGSCGDEAGRLRTLIAAVRSDLGNDAIRQELLEAVERKAGLRS